MRHLHLLVLLAIALPTAPLGAQGVPQGAPSRARVGRVRGVVLDSLLGAPLAGATVTIMAAGREAHSDSSGRFVLDSVPTGEWVIGFHHPALDSIGLSVTESLVRVFAGVTAITELATPSFDTFQASLCGIQADSIARTVAFGAVRSQMPSHRVEVGILWRVPATDTPLAKPTLGTVPMASGQRWQACGIPYGAWVRATARDSAYAADALFQIGPRGIARHDLAIDSGTSPVHGRVLDAVEHPVVGARVTIVDSPLVTETDAWGQFTLRDVPRATRTLDVRAAGFAPRVLVIEADGSSVPVRLERLSPPGTEEQFGSDRLRFEARRGREGQRLVDGTALPTSRDALALLLPVGACQWWLDGRPVSRDFALAQPVATLRALESYARGDDAPPEFRASDCGVVLLWTSAADW